MANSVSVILTDPYLALFGGKTGSKFTFNGSNQYAVMGEAWGSLGFPAAISFNANAVAFNPPNSAYLIDAPGDPGAATFGDVSLWTFTKKSDGTSGILNTGAISTGTNYKWSAAIEADSTSATVAATASDEAARLTIPGAISHIGTSADNPGGVNTVWHGTISGLLLEDNSPIQDGVFQVGDGNFNGDLDDQIQLGGEWRINYDWVREEQGTATQYHFSYGEASNICQARLYDSLHPTVGFRHRYQIYIAGNLYNFDDALAHVAIGQHVHVELYRDASDLVHLLIDGVEAAGSPSTPLPGNCYISKIGASFADGVRFRGALANFKIETSIEGSDSLGFIDYGSSSPRVADAFSNDSSLNTGLLQILGTPVYTPGMGAKYQNNNTWVRWNDPATPGIDWTRINNEGYTLQYKVEKGLFSDVGSFPDSEDVCLGVLQGASRFDGILRRVDIDAFNVGEGVTSPTYTGADWRTINDTYDDYVRVDISYDPTGNGTMELYLNKFLVASETFSSNPGTIQTIQFTGTGSFGGIFNHQYFIKDVQLVYGAVGAWAQSEKRIAWVGDSFGVWGQYQSDYIANNTPVLEGVSIANAQYDALPSATNTYDPRQLTAFAWAHKEFFEKGITPLAANDQGTGDARRIESYSRAGSTVRNPNPIGGGLDSLKDRIDAALGVAGNPPGGSTGPEIWVIQCGGNDVSADVDVSDFENDLVVQLERLANLEETQHIYLIGVTDKFDANSSGNNPSKVAEFNASQQSIAGNFPLVTYVPLSDWDITYTAPDLIHPGVKGMKYIAEQLGQYLLDSNFPSGDYTFDFPMNEGSGNRITNVDPVTSALGGTWLSGTNWTQIGTNTRWYPMNEGPGATVFKCYLGKGGPHYPAGDATITNPTAPGGGWDYEP